MTTIFDEGSEIVLKYACYGLMNIKQIDQQMLDSKYTPLKVTDISHCRMDFISNLNLPIIENVIWCFLFKYQNEELSLRGIIRERSILENGYVYTVEWLEEEKSVGVLVLQTLCFWEHQFKYEFEKAVRGYVNSIKHSIKLENKTTIDVSC